MATQTNNLTEVNSGGGTPVVEDVVADSVSTKDLMGMFGSSTGDLSNWLSTDNKQVLNDYTNTDTGSKLTVTETPEEAVQDVSGGVNVVNTDELEANQTEFKVPSSLPTGDLSYTPTVTNDEKILAEINAKMGQVGELQDKLAVKQKEDEMNKSREDVMSAYDELGDLAGFIEGVEEDAQVQKYREELTEIVNKIRKKELDFRRQVEGIQDTAGLTRAQKNARIADVDRRNSREIADLEIIAMARQGRYNDAMAVVDRKVQVELMERQTKLEGLKFLYQENKERFSTDEQRAFEKNILSEERAYQKEYDKIKELESLKLQMTINATEAGAGFAELQAIQNAGDTTSLFSVPNANRYMKSKAQVLDEQLKSLQISKASQELAAIQETATTGVSPVTGKPYTENQAKAGLFASRIEDSNSILDDGKGLFVPEWIAPDWAKTAERRQFEQAENNFITATLRRESGAAIADSEYETARRVYIPLYTDDADTLAQKKRARDTILNALKNESVGAYEDIRTSLQTQASQTGFTAGSYLDSIEEQLNSSSSIYGVYYPQK